MAPRRHLRETIWSVKLSCTRRFFACFLLILSHFITEGLSESEHFKSGGVRNKRGKTSLSLVGSPRNVESGIETQVCAKPEVSPFDYSVKSITTTGSGVCPTLMPLRARATQDDDYSCSEHKPCNNGACCSKATGYCNYGPDACGTDGISPNDKCWSNCDAHAECGRNAKTPGAKCPLNVCCSEFGFCGMTDEFCKQGKNKEGGRQSGCEQPGSGADGGDVQQRIIGYYESWAHGRPGYEMDIKDIPVQGLTHLYFSFGSITSDSLEVITMDHQPMSLFSDFTDLKRLNPTLKTVVAIGGWAFNDNGTNTQPLFSKIVGSVDTRATFIRNILNFLRQYAFDGVDFDWEYPGAPDRGGHDADGPNFTVFLREFQDAIKKEGKNYVVSFTIPTSYWYLRWFDLAAVQHVDFVNVMSYDLHGIWDSINPIGNKVLSHTNLTEIKQAFNLLWRNEVPAQKLNLGLGFYGRSFQLSDPKCSKPGCNFKAGASPGPITQSSGTLSFREIDDIIQSKHITPEYDKENAAKWIVWDQDQWASYDDADTFKQKIDFANKLGLGGLMIWAIDLDTKDHKALQAVLAPKTIPALASKLAMTDTMQVKGAETADCYTTNCGGTCKVGFIPITQQPCGGAKPGNRHAKEKPSSLCCPLSGAPDPKKCTWRGDFPACNGRCHDNEVTLQQNKWGDGKYCESGQKVYCCEQAASDNQCYWTGIDQHCKANDLPKTFAGTFLKEVEKVFSKSLTGAVLEEWLNANGIKLLKRYCCPPDELKKWKMCAWHGKPGVCDDNKCPIGHSIQLATSEYGEGKTCWPRLERQRVYCCEKEDESSPFLPVPLDHLFPQPPTGDDVRSKYELDTDHTWGKGKIDAKGEKPNDSSFGFVVLASPAEIQTSLNKRDGSHWELFDCHDATSEEAQTVKMFCTDASESSNCHNIRLGGFVAGTILEMPPGCGPSKYAVAKFMALSPDQRLPPHLAKRDYGHQPTVYDLTFDFEWHRVRRDMGETQMRIDYSNEKGYWDNVVAAARDSKRKRSLDESGGDHKRWLEEEWRDDFHHQPLNSTDLHKRWFGVGPSILWFVRMGLTKLADKVGPVKVSTEVTHDLDTSFTAVLVKEKWGPCKVRGVDVEANILAQAKAHVKVSTSFGFSLITKLQAPIDLSQAYLYFKNKGEVSATFTFDAMGRATFDSGDKELFGLQNFPGKPFSIPKLFSIGPNFRLFAAVEAEVTLAGHLEAKVQIAKWDVQQAYPALEADADPRALSDPNRDGSGDFQGLRQPTFNYAVVASGQVTAHLKPTFEFGIIFDPMWHASDARVALVADGWTRVMAAAGVSKRETCPFTYGIDLGADLYATVEAPMVGWKRERFPIASAKPIAVKPGGTCPQQKKRSLSAFETLKGPIEVMEYPGAQQVPESLNSSVSRRFEKRGETVIGPLLKLPTSCFFCPTNEQESDGCANLKGWQATDGADDDDDASDSMSKRTVALTSDPHSLEQRATKNHPFCGGLKFKAPNYDSSGKIINKIKDIKTYGMKNPNNCDDFDFGVVTTPTDNTGDFATEHLLEFQMLKIFFNKLDATTGANFVDGRTGRPQKLCGLITQYWANDRILVAAEGFDTPQTPIVALPQVFPSNKNDYKSEFVLLDQDMNGVKERFWSDKVISSDKAMQGLIDKELPKAFKNLRNVIATYKYHQDPFISTTLAAQIRRVAVMLEKIETQLSTMDLSSEGLSRYQSANLRRSWEEFMRARSTSTQKKVKDYLDTWIPKLQAVHEKDPKGRSGLLGGTSMGAKLDAVKQQRRAIGSWDTVI